ncbi:hypothetical protein SDC9_128123 [bioreactor metagenome]|uniref:Uncharacterized protein n=1 Tax=bioreactor metagenome TaxID=1076179 RepID=A0A645CVY1_9ZZZZ
MFVLLHDLPDVGREAFQLIILCLDVDAHQSHDAVADHGPLLVDATSVGNPCLGDDLDGKGIHLLLQRPCKECLEHLCMDLSLHHRILVVQLKHGQPPQATCTASPGSCPHG